ncbi:MAG: hypothetical protein HYX27_18565 [Acidobacteria bacterium]|nr:hypothetical protein [Acidobacteriota bacterium]
MNRFFSLAASSLLLAASALAGPIDGKWVSERKVERDGQSTTIVQTFELKAEGDKLTGKLNLKFGDMEPPSVDIKDGKLDGNKFSFTTTMSTPNGDFKMSYSGTVEGGMLKGTAEREGGQPRPFEAKKQ